MTVSVVIPTFNEAENIGFLIDRVRSTLNNPEIVVVDDGKDATKDIAAAKGAVVIEGQRKGLGQAIIDGLRTAQGQVIVCMDADGSHNPDYLPDMIHAVAAEGYDMAVGSRYVKGGGSADWNWYRKLISRVACLFASPVTSIRDATSGFFAIRRSLIEGVNLSGSSWKTMLEIAVKCNPIVKEVPIQFTKRLAGESKLTSKQMVHYIIHLCQLAAHKYRRFGKFAVIGGTAAVITFGLTWILTDLVGLWYMLSLAIATSVSMLWNFNLNAIVTFAQGKKPTEADYEWFAFFKGNPVQKWWKRQIAHIIWEWVPPTARLLNVGCGSSPVMQRYPTACGIDTDANKVAFMAERFKSARFYCMSGAKTVFPAKAFDYVVASEVIEHLEKPNELVNEISRLLSDNGVAVIAVPDSSKWLWHIAERFTPYKDDHKQAFNRSRLVSMFGQVGMVPIRHKYVAGCDLVMSFQKVNHAFVA
jgi:dolichol-phosphate mannosyltransferase